MKTFDRYLQRYRMRMILPFLRAGARVLDIGCGNGELLAYAPPLAEYVGVDPTLRQSQSIPSGTFIKGTFPADLSPERRFDFITLLAVLEHIPANHLRTFAVHCSQRLEVEGHLLMTVPSRQVDKILSILRAVRLIDGMSLEEHHGFDASVVPQMFEGVGLKLTLHRRFQLGLNNLFVFKKLAPAAIT